MLNREIELGLWLKNCPEFIPSLWILAAGAVAVPIMQLFEAGRGELYLDDVGSIC